LLQHTTKTVRYNHHDRRGSLLKERVSKDTKREERCLEEDREAATGTQVEVEAEEELEEAAIM